MKAAGGHSKAIIILAFLAAGAALSRAEEPAAPVGAPDILVIVRSLQPGGEAFRRVIGDAARYELEGRGLRVAFPDAGSAGAAADPLGQARQRKAAVAVECVYSLADEEMELSVSWWDTGSGSRTAAADARGRVDLQLDSVILEALHAVLSSSEARVRQLAAARETQNAARAAEQQAAEGGGDGGGTGTLEAGGGALPGPGREARAGRGAPRVSSTHLLITGGFAPFIATGAASYYFTLGYLPSILASIIFETPAGRIGLGVQAGLNYFAAQGGVDSSDNFLIPVGGDLRYEIALSRFLFSLHLGGGAAVLVIATSSSHTYVNVMPFVKSGIGAEFLVMPWLGISLTADYEIYFEVPYLFMGITPSLGMTFRL
jgi:hypothetical protein